MTFPERRMRRLRRTPALRRLVAESLLAGFPAPRVVGERVLLARAETARDVLPDGLRARGVRVDAEADPHTIDALVARLTAVWD